MDREEALKVIENMDFSGFSPKEQCALTMAVVALELTTQVELDKKALAKMREADEVSLIAAPKLLKDREGKLSLKCTGDEFQKERQMPTASDVVAALKKMGEDNLADALSDALIKAGYKVHKLDNAAPSGRINPFSGMFDVFGDGKKAFIEKLAEIFNISIIEETDTYIRFAYTDKNYVFHSEYELQKTYADYATLLESMKGSIEIEAVKGL